MRLLAVLAVSCLTLVACGSDEAATCIELREPRDPLSGQHILGDGSATWRSNPPTSGPHVAAPTPSGSRLDPINPALQVRILEGGGVMIQYDDTLDADEITTLADLGRRDIVVAPGFGELPDRIVVTAWTWKLSCPSYDEQRIATFIETRPMEAPGLDG